jgi:hypothetical protein
MGMDSIGCIGKKVHETFYLMCVNVRGFLLPFDKLRVNSK